MRSGRADMKVTCMRGVSTSCRVVLLLATAGADGGLRLDRRGAQPFPVPGGAANRATPRRRRQAPQARRPSPRPAVRPSATRRRTRSPARPCRCAARRIGTAAPPPRASTAAASCSTSTGSTASRCRARRASSSAWDAACDARPRPGRPGLLHHGRARRLARRHRDWAGPVRPRAERAGRGADRASVCGVLESAVCRSPASTLTLSRPGEPDTLSRVIPARLRPTLSAFAKSPPRLDISLVPRLQ